MSQNPNSYESKNPRNQAEIETRIIMVEALRSQYDGRTCSKCWTESGMDRYGHCHFCGWSWLPLDAEVMQPTMDEPARKPYKYDNIVCAHPGCKTEFQPHNPAHKFCPAHSTRAQQRARTKEIEEGFVYHHRRRLTANHPWKSAMGGLK